MTKPRTTGNSVREPAQIAYRLSAHLVGDVAELAMFHASPMIELSVVVEPRSRATPSIDLGFRNIEEREVEEAWAERGINLPRRWKGAADSSGTRGAIGNGP